MLLHLVWILVTPTDLVEGKAFQLCCIQSVELRGLENEAKGCGFQRWDVAGFRGHSEGTLRPACPRNSDLSFGVIGQAERKWFHLLEPHTATKIKLPNADTDVRGKDGEVAGYAIMEIFSHGVDVWVLLRGLVFRDLGEGNRSLSSSGVSTIVKHTPLKEMILKTWEPGDPTALTANATDKL